MTTTETGAPTVLHGLRGALNGVVLQLEVAALALERADEALLRKALTAARQAAAEATSRLAALDAGTP